MKKCLRLLTLIIFSAIISGCKELFIYNYQIIFNILLNILAVSFAVYTFLYTPLLKIYENSKKRGNNNSEKIKKFLNESYDNIILIFFSLLFVIIVNWIFSIDIPFINQSIFNDTFIDKDYLCRFSLTLCVNFSIFCFYDLMKSAYVILYNDFC